MQKQGRKCGWRGAIQLEDGRVKCSACLENHASYQDMKEWNCSADAPDSVQLNPMVEPVTWRGLWS